MCAIRRGPIQGVRIAQNAEAAPTEGEDRLIPFFASLVAEDLSPKTVDGYRQDLLAFRRSYRESRGTDLRWEKLGSNDLINYQQHLVSVKAKFVSEADGWLVAYASAHRHTVMTNGQPRPESKNRILLPDV